MIIICCEFARSFLFMSVVVVEKETRIHCDNVSIHPSTAR